MHRLAILAILLASGSLWAQSLGDVARETRERPKVSAKTITNEDLTPPEPETSFTPIQQELDRMRVVFRQICDDPRTNNGHDLSEYDKVFVEEAVRPLRARKIEWERTQKDYKNQIAALDKEQDETIEKDWPKGKSTQADLDRMKTINEDYDARRKAIRDEAEQVLKPYVEFGRQLEEVEKDCPAAADSVPD